MRSDIFSSKDRFPLSAGRQLVVSLRVYRPHLHTHRRMESPPCVSSKWPGRMSSPCAPRYVIRRSWFFLTTRRSSISPPATGNSGSSTARTTSATSIRPRLAFAATSTSSLPVDTSIRFLLTEISSEPNVQPDLKLFVEPKESSGGTSLQGYVRAGEAEAYKRELQTLREQTETRVRAAEAGVAERLNRFRSEYAAKLRFDYTLEGSAGREPFLVGAIYHDDLFTYIHCAAREKPALYEVKDGKPNLIQFQFENDVYIAPKIIDNGYLAVGKKKLVFTRHVSGQ